YASFLTFWIYRQRSNAESPQPMCAAINAHPGRTSIVRSIHTAAPLRILIVLISITGEQFIRVARIDQNAGEISEGQVTAAARPVIAAIMRHVKSLLGSNVDE